VFTACGIMHGHANIKRSYIFNIPIYVILCIWIIKLIEYMYLKIQRMDNFQTTAEEVLRSKEPYFNHMDTKVP